MRELFQTLFGDIKFKFTFLYALHFDLLNAENEIEVIVDSKIKRHATCNYSYEM